VKITHFFYTDYPNYQWRKEHRECGVNGLTKASIATKRIWNRLTQQEREHILIFARQHPEFYLRGYWR